MNSGEKNRRSRVVLDTNNIISGIFWRGNSSALLKLAEEEKIELFLSEDIIGEIRNIMLRDKFQLKLENMETYVERIIEKLIEVSEIVEPVEKLDVVKEDKADNKFIECAIECNADYIISGDSHLLNLGESMGVKIITAREFLDLFHSKKT